MHEVIDAKRNENNVTILMSGKHLTVEFLDSNIVWPLGMLVLLKNVSQYL